MSLSALNHQYRVSIPVYGGITPVSSLDGYEIHPQSMEYQADPNEENERSSDELTHGSLLS